MILLLTATPHDIFFSCSLFRFRYLELQSSGRRNEIRFHYSYLGPKNELMVHTESFPYRLADNKWHKLALSISGTEIQLIVDCHPLYRRVTHYVPDRNFSASNMQLLVGQRNSNNHFLFKVRLKECRVSTGIKFPTHLSLLLH